MIWGVIEMMERPQRFLRGFAHGRLYVPLVGLLVVASSQLTVNQVTATSQPDCAFDVTKGDIYAYQMSSDVFEDICVSENSRLHP